MSKLKPSTPKGTRDFSPVEMQRRTYIYDIIKKHFKLAGFQNIETPAMENLSTLTGKYGDEGDKLIFKIQDSGRTFENKLEDFANIIIWYQEKFFNRLAFIELVGASSKEIESYVSTIKNLFSDIDEKEKSFYFVEIFYEYLATNEAKYFIENYYEEDTDKRRGAIFNTSGFFKHFRDYLSSYISEFSEKALRYDLTVPFARYVVQHQNDITFPFKRYQIQPVWRADRPQKGRYREFYQCDADVVGSNSLLYELEFVKLFDNVLSDLLIPDFSIKINNRKILSGIAEVCGEAEKIIDITVAIDKLDKIGQAGVIKELQEKGVSSSAITILTPLFTLEGENKSKIKALKTILMPSAVGMKGLNELSFVLDAFPPEALKKAKLEFDVTLARGLNYYTGAIFEVKANGVSIGSICGGGRYDDLTGIFGLPDISGIGISFGADRIYDVLNELNLFPDTVRVGTQVLFANFGVQESLEALKLCATLRTAGIASEVYPDDAKMKKQFKYAEVNHIKYIVMLGTDELAKGVVGVKNIVTGEQVDVSLNNFETSFLSILSI